MNILQVNQFYAPHTGGIECVARQIGEGLAERGHTSCVLAAVERGRGVRENISGVKVVRAPSLGVLLSAPLTPTLPVHLRKLSRWADVVHLHLPHPLGVVSHLVAAPQRVPTVVTYHSDIVRQAGARKLYQPFLHRFLSEVDRIMPTSPILMEESPVLSCYAGKCDPVPLAIDLKETLSGPRTPPPPLDLDDDRPLLLFVGRLIYYKGIEFLLEAMHDVDAHLVIVGGGPLRETLERRAAEAGVTERVTFLGFIPEEQLRYCYEQADLFVLPSSAPSEAFGIVQLEAMAHGTPVINTDLPTGVPWVSQDGKTGRTVPPRDVDALTYAIQELLADTSLRARFGRNARERVQREFTVEGMISSIEGVYKDVFSQTD